MNLILKLLAVFYIVSLLQRSGVRGATYPLELAPVDAARSLQKVLPFMRSIVSPVKAFFRPITNRIQIFLELFEWYGPEIEMGTCFYETAFGYNPMEKARGFAKELIKSLFAKMRDSLSAPPTEPSYESPFAAEYPGSPVYKAPAVPVEALPQFESSQFPSQQQFDANTQSYYVRRQDFLAPPRRVEVPPSMVQSSYSRVRKARQHYEPDEYFEHWHAPQYVIHPPEPLYEESDLPPASDPNLEHLKQEWLNYFENLILSKFGFVDAVKSNSYVQCTQSYSFIILTRTLGKLLSYL